MKLLYLLDVPQSTGYIVSNRWTLTNSLKYSQDFLVIENNSQFTKNTLLFH